MFEYQNVKKVTEEYFEPTGKTPPNDFLETLHLRLSLFYHK